MIQCTSISLSFVSHPHVYVKMKFDQIRLGRGRKRNLPALGLFCLSIKSLRYIRDELLSDE